MELTRKFGYFWNIQYLRIITGIMSDNVILGLIRFAGVLLIHNFEDTLTHLYRQNMKV